MIFAATAFEHVFDSLDWHMLESLHIEIHLPGIRTINLPDGFGITKYTLLMLLAAGMICAIYIPLAKRIQTGETPKGTCWNLFESVLTFIRNEIAKPYIGADADRYVPYLWTVFLFVLTCNLLGMVPFLGSPTASFAVTAVLGLSAYIVINTASIMRFGLKAHLLSFFVRRTCDAMPFALKLGISLMLWPIEFIGLMLKCFVLAVRLFANMFAGHMVLATILLFIPAVQNAGPGLEWSVTIASVLGVIALSLLELFVAFLQAYLFTFLTALFLGGVLEHAEHAAHPIHDKEHSADGHFVADAGDEDVHLKGNRPGHAH